MIRESSRESLQSVSGMLSQKKREVYETLYKNEDPSGLTANEIFVLMALPVLNQANILARLGELRDLGVVKEVGVKTCHVTGRNVIAWATTGLGVTEAPKRVSLKTRLRQAEDFIAGRGLAATYNDYLAS